MDFTAEEMRIRLCKSIFNPSSWITFQSVEELLETTGFPTNSCIFLMASKVLRFLQLINTASASG